MKEACPQAPGPLLSRPCLLSHYSLPASGPPRPQSFSLLALGDSSLSSPDPASARLSWQCAACAMHNESWAVLCVACDRPRGCKGLGLGIEGPQGTGGLEPELARGHWACQSCTFENEAAAVLCAICERPRLAQPPSLVVDSRDADICLQPLQVTYSWPSHTFICTCYHKPFSTSSSHFPLISLCLPISSLYFHFEPQPAINEIILSAFSAGEYFALLCPDSSLVLYSLYLLQLGLWLGMCYVQPDQQPHPSKAHPPAACPLFGRATLRTRASPTSQCPPAQFLWGP